MLQFISTIWDSLAGNVIGGTGSIPIWVAALVILILCVGLLLIARIGFEFVLLIVAPGVVLASFAGFLPPFTFGVWVIILAVFWTGIIMSIFDIASSISRKELP